MTIIFFPMLGGADVDRKRASRAVRATAEASSHPGLQQDHAASTFEVNVQIITIIV